MNNNNNNSNNNNNNNNDNNNNNSSNSNNNFTQKPFTVAPANNSSTSLNSLFGGNYPDYIDFDSFFTDDFFPPELDFTNFFQFDDSNQYYDDDNNYSKINHQQQPESANNIDLVLRKELYPIDKSKVIMIPPFMPKKAITLNKNISNENNKLNLNSKSSYIKKEKKDESDVSDDEKDKKSKSKKNKKQKVGKNEESSDEFSDDDNDKDPEDSQKVERRERNREHAKRSRIRKRLLIDTLQDRLAIVRNENIKLRRVLSEKLPMGLSQKILAECTAEESTLLFTNSDNEDDNNNYYSATNHKVPSAKIYKPSPLTSNIAQHQPLLATSVEQRSKGSSTSSSNNNNNNNSDQHPVKRRQHAKILMEPDYRLIESLITAQQNFVLSDPSLPDNPIVYASDGFCKLVGYRRDQIVGRNCRFLQGEGTDQAAVEIIRQGVAEGRDISVCLLNYKADGTPFWNQFFVACLRDSKGDIVNYVGVQCEVNTIPIHEMKERVKKLPIPTDSYSSK